MEKVLPSSLVDCLMISMALSIVMMSLLQKFKKLPIIKKPWQIWILNLLFSFLIGVPFSNTFYGTSMKDGLWISFFCFLGAPMIYSALKKQNLLQYRPESLPDDVVEIPVANEIKLPQSEDDEKANKSITNEVKNEE